MKLKVVLIALLSLAGCPAASAQGCTGQPASGLVCANPTSGASLPGWTTVTLLFDRSFGATQGTILNRGASNWAETATPLLGLNGGTGGSVTLRGATSGSSIIGVRAAAGSSVFNLPVGNGSANFVLITDGAGNTSWTNAGSGTVSSVGMVLPSSILTVSGSPVTSTGTLTGTLATQLENTVWSGPASGSAATPAFRALVGADLPNPSASSLGGIQSTVGASHQWISSISTSGIPGLTQPSFSDISGTATGTQLPNPSPTTLGGIESLAAVTSKWINQISTSGSPSATQPTFSDISGSAALSQLPFVGNNTILSNISGGSAAPLANSASSIFDTIGSTQGDILYRNASGWTVLPPGTSGQVLSSGGAAANPSWSSISGTGTVTSITTNNGITGGTITTSGTIGLAAIATGNVLANTTGGVAVPTATAPTAILDVVGSTEGEVLYRGASTWSALPPGTTGQFLQTAGAGSTPNWSSAVTSVACGTGLSGGTITTSGTCSVNLAAFTNSIVANVLLNNTANFFDGPSIAQGTTGTWWASGTVVVEDTANAASFICKLWDGTTVIDASVVSTPGIGLLGAISLSGFLASPAANLRISCRDLTSANGLMLFNSTATSKDSTISAHRIQ